MDINTLHIIYYALFHSVINYEKFKQQYSTSSSTTRCKVIIPPKYDKRISTKRSYIKAINIFNKLPNENKTLDLRKKSNKKKLKDWVSEN